jgi:hypothetical protein
MSFVHLVLNKYFYSDILYALAFLAPTRKSPSTKYFVSVIINDRSTLSLFTLIVQLEMPTVLSKAISATVTSSQKRHVYHPARRSHALKQSKADNQKFKAALDNEPDPYRQSYTSNARVFPEYKGGVTVAWRITIRRRRHASPKTSTNKKSGARYNSQIVAKNEMYAFRKSLEQKAYSPN